MGDWTKSDRGGDLLLISGLLERHERERDEALAGLKLKLRRGAERAERGELLDGDAAFEELREMMEDRRRAKAAGVEQ